MNLFREVRFRRRSSSANSGKEDEGDEGGAGNSVYAVLSNGHASLRRSLLPRSKTATTSELRSERSSRAIPSSATTTSLSDNPPAVRTDWSYCRPPSEPPKPLMGGPPPPQVPTGASIRPRRSESLRDRRCPQQRRSVTVPNFQQHEVSEEDTADSSLQDHERTFSTFKQQRPKNRRMDTNSNCGGRAAISRVPRSASCHGDKGSNDAFRRLGHPGDNSSAASAESLLDDDNNCIVTDTSFSATSTTANSLELLNEADEDAAVVSVVSGSGGRPVVHRSRRVAGHEEDLVEVDSGTNSTSSATSLGSAAAGQRCNSLPKSAFGSIQLKVQEIRDQLDVLKSNTNQQQVSCQQRALPVGAASVTQRSALQLFGLSSYFTSSPAGSSGPDTDSISPRSGSPTCSGAARNKQAAGGHVPPALPACSQLKPHSLALTLSNSSSSPSTLSPCSSNSATSASLTRPPAPQPSRPQPMPRMSQSNSFHSFGSATAASQMVSARDDLDLSSVSQAERLVFFLDIVSTQERIAKVV